MNCRHTLVGALIAIVGWIVGYYLGMEIFAGQLGGAPIDASENAVVIGWWFTAYLSARFMLPVGSVAPLAVGHFVLFQIAAIGGYDWFYRDARSLTVIAALGLGFAQAFVVSSPVLFDWGFRQAIRACLQKPRQRG